MVHGNNERTVNLQLMFSSLSFLGTMALCLHRVPPQLCLLNCKSHLLSELGYVETNLPHSHTMDQHLLESHQETLGRHCMSVVPENWLLNI